MKNLVRSVLEKHLRTVLAGLSPEEIGQHLEASAARVETAASPDLGKMGLGIVGFTIKS
jgi:flotillin